MSTPKTKEERLLEMFDSFCNTTIDNAVKHYQRKHSILNGREIATSPEIVDEYEGSDGSYRPTFHIRVDELSCEVNDETLYNALLTLPKKEMQVLILDFWYLLRDKEIADYLEVTVRTVYNRRIRAFRTIQRFYEEQPP